MTDLGQRFHGHVAGCFLLGFLPHPLAQRKNQFPRNTGSEICSHCLHGASGTWSDPKVPACAGFFTLLWEPFSGLPLSREPFDSQTSPKSGTLKKRGGGPRRGNWTASLLSAQDTQGDRGQPCVELVRSPGGAAGGSVIS